MLVRTSVNHISSVARSEVFSDNSDIIEGEMWNSILDGRTSSICRSLDGKVFELGKGKRPPAHPNCRSYMTPILKGIEPAPRTSYAEWFAKQSSDKQDSILGKTKGKLYREGKLPLSAFTGDNGKALTLKQLKEQHKIDLSNLAQGADGKGRYSTVIPKDYKSAMTLTGINANAQKAIIDKAKDGNEWVTIADTKTGKTFEPVSSGLKGNVNLSKEMMTAITKNPSDVVIHHNHPLPASFSGSDVQTAEDLGIKELFAHAHNGSVFKLDGIKSGATKQYDIIYDKIAEIGNKYQNVIIDTDEKTLNIINLQWQHLVVQSLNKLGYLNYKYSFPDDMKLDLDALSDSKIWNLINKDLEDYLNGL